MPGKIGGSIDYGRFGTQMVHGKVGGIVISQVFQYLVISVLAYTTKTGNDSAV